MAGKNIKLKDGTGVEIDYTGVPKIKIPAADGGSDVIFQLPPTLQEKSVSITFNGTIDVIPDSGYDGMSKVQVVVDVAGSVGTLTRSIVKSTVGDPKSISIPKSVDSFHVILANLGDVKVKAPNGAENTVSLSDDGEFDVVNGQPIPDYVVNRVTWYTFSAKETDDGLSYTYTITPTLTVGSTITLFGVKVTVVESNYGCSFIAEYFV